MKEIDSSQILSQLRQIAAQAQPQKLVENEQGGGVDFSALLRNSIDSVNEAQKQGGKLTEAFELGDPNVDIGEVMIALQKANITFEAMVQVRNKLVHAYQEIMNMPI